MGPRDGLEIAEDNAWGADCPWTKRTGAQGSGAPAPPEQVGCWALTGQEAGIGPGPAGGCAGMAGPGGQASSDMCSLALHPGPGWLAGDPLTTSGSMPICLGEMLCYWEALRERGAALSVYT
ncbi:hypothetical protein NDU88_006061 [Pleurodeles waltl]|uniref:Uncharacterized protein n=1 Tax=Pleurodeles waltl TaxID=8319 RepID=A0AAV7VNI1_PLEWA|nr:hypothetical protein NDU88_006061 [Pleurodeles waltl]